MNNNHTFNIWTKLFSVSLILVMALSACSGGKAAQSPTTVELSGAASLQNSTRSEQEVAKLAPPAEAPAQMKAQPGSPDPGADSKRPPVDPGGNEPPAQAPVEPLPTIAGAVPAQAAPLPQVTVDPSIPIGPQIGLRAPDFTLQTLDGQTLHLADLAGRPVVISYWATWCIPCKAELPILERIYKEYQQQGLAIISVNATDQDTVEDVQSLVAELGMTFPVLLDSSKDFASTYQAIFFPTTVFIDASGVIRHIQLGDSSEAKLRTHIQNLFTGGF